MTEAPTNILQTIDLALPIHCPSFDPHKAQFHCHGCRFYAICEAAREEFGE